MSGKRTRIKGENVKHIHVPCYENLTIQEFLKFAQGYPAALQALPEVEKETLKMSRAYIAAVIHTIVGAPFRE